MPLTIVNPYARQPGRKYIWLKGNLHAHSNCSDGSRSPQEVVDAYAAGGYNFLALTDHDVFADYSGLDDRGLVFLPGNEVSAFGSHMLQLGGWRRIEAYADRQKVIDQVNGEGGMAVLNHANWQSQWNHWPLEEMARLSGYAGMEIFNGVCVDLEGSGLAIDKWDRLLSSGRMVWGLANDDSHRPNHDARGWNVVQVAQSKVDAVEILAALKAGAFYASTGVTIEAIETKATILHVVASNAQEIEVYGQYGARLAKASGTDLYFDACNRGSPFFRVQCYGQGSQMAWTQPFLVHGGAEDRHSALEKQFAAPDAPRPKLKALRVEEIPALDSAQATRLWLAAVASDVFYDRNTAGTPPVRTAVSAMVSQTELALRIECQEPEMDKIHNRIDADGNNAMWSEESVEVYLDVEGKQQRYYQLQLNPAGAFCASESHAGPATLKCRRRVMRQSDGWTVDIVLDLATLAPDRPIREKDQFGLHLCRNRHTVLGHYIWSWVGFSDYAPWRFGRLEL